MKSHRGHGEGHIRKRTEPSGYVRWEAQLSLPDGSRKSLYGKTRQEVQQKLSQARHDLEAGLPLPEGRQTVSQYLTSWLETVRPPRLVYESWLRYKREVELHINPGIGHVRLKALTPAMVQQLYNDCQTKGLSGSTCKHVHSVLHRALQMAMRLGLVARNVADLVEIPRKEPVDIKPLSWKQARAFLEAAHGERLEAFFVVALATGMRMGELLALTWAAVDLDHGAITVLATLKKRRGTPAILAQPKTHRSRRRIRLATYVVSALHAHAAQQLTERMAAGPFWEDQDLVFCTEVGAPLPRSVVERTHAKVLQAASLPHIRPHDLRHTCATLLLAARVNPKVVSEQLGHASVAFTLQTYAHVLPDMQEDAVVAMSETLGWDGERRDD